MTSKDKRLTLPNYLFWDLDTAAMDVDYAYQTVIERVIQLGTLEQWKNTQQYFGSERFLEVARLSKQLSQREREFTALFTQSTFNAPVSA